MTDNKVLSFMGAIMSSEQFANKVQTSLSATISSGATSISVASATGFPATANFRILIDNELLIVTALSGTTWTVTRGAEGTTAAAHGAGASVTHVLTAASVQNIGMKKPVRAATAAVLPNSPTYSGATKRLSAGSNGALTVDGVSVAVGERILVKNQATGSQNGIYTVIAVGDGSNPYVLERDADFWESADVLPSLLVTVSEGSVNADTLWSLTTNAPITLDTTSLVFGPVTGGGGSVTSAYASRPAAGTDGKLFLPNDGFSIERDNGSAWAPWGPLFPFTPPVDGDFSWVNQDTATVTTTNGGIYITNETGNGNVLGSNLRVKPKTGTWTLTVAVIPHLHIGANTVCVPLCAYESSTGKLVNFHIHNTNGGAVGVQRYASPTSGEVHLVNFISAAHYWSGGVFWCRMTNNGTTLTFHTSTNGENFRQLVSVNLTTAFTTDSDRIGFGVHPFNAAAGMTLLSWKET